MNGWHVFFLTVFGSLTVAPVASRLLASTVTETPAPGPTAEESYAAWADRHRAFVADLERRAAAGEDVTRPASTAERGDLGRAIVAAATAVNARAIPTTTRSARDGTWMPTARDVAEARSQLAYDQHTAACAGDHDILRTYGEPGFRWTCNPFVAHRRDPDELAERREAARRLHREVLALEREHRRLEYDHWRLKRNAPTLPTFRG